jgi:periplasmic divalent cation tolerance protein
MSHELIVLVTASSHTEAVSIADAVVTERLAACVNIIDAIQSIYRWEGKVTHDPEALMIIKTTDDRYPELERRVRALHSYDTPEVIGLRIDCGSADYLMWLRAATTKPDEDVGD